jgi:peptidylprolyl isomerase
MRTGIAILLAAGLIGSLAACSSPAEEPTSQASGDCAVTKSGAVSDAIDVSGDFGSKPTVKIDTPITTKTTERSVVIEGDAKGGVAEEGQQVALNFLILNGTSGEELSAPEFTKAGSTTFTIDESQFLVGLVKTLRCSEVGSRVVGVIPPADSWGDTGSTELGVDPADSIVFVADIVSVVPSRATGEDQPVEEGFPTVTLADDGTPTVTIPDGKAPTELKLTVLKKGDGAEVKDGASVTVQYQGTNWDTKEIFDQSWGRGAATFTTDGVVEGFSKALVGQTVGSQVLVVIPPALGYGEAGSSDNALAGQTLVFVIDILSVA